MTSPGRIVVVEKEVNARTALVEVLRGDGFEVVEAADGRGALDAIDGAAADLVVSDLGLPDLTGPDLVARVRALPDPPAVIVVTSFGAEETAVAALRAGAADYLTKPIRTEELRVVVARVLDDQRLHAEVARMRRHLRGRVEPPQLVADSPAMQRILETIDQIAATRASVLITGEVGTGKELIAAVVHERSTRADRPFIKLSCAALSGPLLEAALFGHERDALPGAHARRDGCLHAADGGTLFLAEIGEMPPVVQARLLRVLEERAVQRVGGDEAIEIDVRMIAAASDDLAGAVEAGRFREDLFYRLGVIHLEVPPLRERRDDLPALARLLLDRARLRTGQAIDDLSPETLAAMASYDWPGNVRELADMIDHAVRTAPHGALDARDLVPPSLPASAARPCPAIPGATLAEVRRHAVLETLAAVDGSVLAAARRLGVSMRVIEDVLRDGAARPRLRLVAGAGS